MELSIEGLSYYGNGVQALSEVSLRIPAGMFGLLGPNGAGKSTLMRTLATLQEADAGKVQLDGLDVLRQKDDVRRILGYLPQEFGLYPKVAAHAMLDHFVVLKGLADGKQRRARVEALLRQTNLWEARDRKLGTYSGGMKQRFGIAVALLGSPRLIIVDEPTAGLDPEERVRFHNLLAEIGENVIVILSTHIVSDVADLCPKMAIIDKGRVVGGGDPTTLVAGMKGKVWSKIVELGEQDKLAGARAPCALHAARRRSQGRRASLADTDPGAGFETAPARPRGRVFRGRARRHAGGVVRCRLRDRTASSCSQRARLLSSWIYFALFFANRRSSRSSPPAAPSSSFTVSTGEGGKVFVNSAASRSSIIVVGIISYLGLLVTAAAFGQAVCQDFEARAEPAVLHHADARA